MKVRKMVSILIIVVVAVLMLTTVVASAEPVSAASKKVKVKWDANGGKIGTAKTTTINVKKGAKIGKLPKTPKKIGYSFKGWYTKKSGGTKITDKTKVKKKVTYYAQWKKGSSSDNSKLVGHWKFKIMEQDHGKSVLMFHEYYFYSDGRFQYYKQKPTYVNKIEGKYFVSNGKVYFKERKFYDADMVTGVDIVKLKYRSYESLYGLMGDMTSTYTLGSDNNGDFLSIASQDYWGGMAQFTDKSVLEKGTSYEFKYRKNW